MYHQLGPWLLARWTESGELWDERCPVIGCDCPRCEKQCREDYAAACGEAAERARAVFPGAD